MRTSYKIKNKIMLIPIFLVTIISLLLTGCWDRIEIDELAIVMCMSIDYDKTNNEFIITKAIAKPSAIFDPEVGGGEDVPDMIVSSKGRTLFEAARNMASRSPRRLFYAHTRIIVIGEKMAKKGIADIIDYVLRSDQLRIDTWVLIKEGEGREVFEAEPEIETDVVNEMLSLIKVREYNAVTVTNRVKEVASILLEPGIAPITGVVELVEAEGRMEIGDENNGNQGNGNQGDEDVAKFLALRGSAIFKDDKLVGFLSIPESRGFVFIKEEKFNFFIPIEYPLKEERYTYFVHEFYRDFKPVIREGEIAFEINITTDGNLLLEGDSMLDVDNPEMLRAMEVRAVNTIKSMVEKTVKKSKELETDIIGFGQALRRKYPDLWNEFKDGWDERLAQIPVEVIVEVNFRRTGLLSESILKEELY